MVLLALYTQKLLGYDAWTSGLVLAPGGLGNMFSLILIAGRLVTRVDQRLLLAFGCLAQRDRALHDVEPHARRWTTGAWPCRASSRASRMGFIFVPLTTLTLATIRRDKLVNATSAFNVLRNLGGSVGIALATTLPGPAQPVPPDQRWSSHVTIWDPDDARSAWPGGPSTSWPRAPTSFTAQRRALAMLYHDDGRPGPGAGLRRRLLAPRHPVLDRAALPAAHAARARRASRAPRGGRPRSGAPAARAGRLTAQRPGRSRSFFSSRRASSEAIATERRAGSTGFTRCMSKPASSVLRRSSA